MADLGRPLTRQPALALRAEPFGLDASRFDQAYAGRLRSFVGQLHALADRDINPVCERRPSSGHRARIYRRDGLHCAYCKIPVERGADEPGIPRPPNRATIDHRTPISRGGDNASHNLATCCNDCNKAKRNLTEQEFRFARAIEIFARENARAEVALAEADEILRDIKANHL